MEITPNDCLQAFIAVNGISAGFLTQVRSPRLQRWACIVGIVGQPAYLYTTWGELTWGVFVSAIAFTFIWLLGIWNFWIKKAKE